MKSFVLALTCASLFLLPLQAQDTPQTADLVGVSKGQMFSAAVIVMTEGQKAELATFFPQVDDKERSIRTLDVGRVYHIRVRHERSGWPQYGVFVVMEGGREISRTEPTYEPVRVQLKAGQRLKVEFPRSYEPYDGKYFQIRGVNCAIVLPRPYWYQDAAPGQFRGKEPFPNSLFFLVDDQWGWGEEKVLDAAATHAARLMKQGVVNNGDYRCEAHFSFMCALTPDGKLPTVFTDMTEQELQKTLREGIATAWKSMKETKCYRPFDGSLLPPISELKKAGYLPANWADDRAYISLAEGLELAKDEVKKWRAANPDRAPKK